MEIEFTICLKWELKKNKSLVDLDRQDQHTQSDAEISYIRKKLIKAEQRGFVDKSQDKILAGFKKKLRSNGK